MSSTPAAEPTPAGQSERPKTEKELAKEAKQREKLEKFRLKQEKLKQQAEQTSNKPKKEKKSSAKEEIVYDLDTKPGDKKVTSNPLPSSYSPKYVEAAWYSWWEKSGFFKPEYNEKLGKHTDGPLNKTLELERTNS